MQLKWDSFACFTDFDNLLTLSIVDNVMREIYSYKLLVESIGKSFIWW